MEAEENFPRHNSYTLTVLDSPTSLNGDSQQVSGGLSVYRTVPMIKNRLVSCIPPNRLINHPRKILKSGKVLEKNIHACCDIICPEQHNILRVRKTIRQGGRDTV